MKYIVDIDGTICTPVDNSQYEFTQPLVDRIKRINDLYDQGHEIHYWTARGGTTGRDWSELTTNQLTKWGVKYTTLQFRKPSYDLWIDDKAINSEAFFNDSTNRA